MISKSEPKALTVYTTADGRTLDHDTQVILAITPPEDEREGPPISPIAWKVFSFIAHQDAEQKAAIVFSHRISTADVEEDKVWKINLNSAGLSVADQYISLTKDMRWGSYRLTDGSEGIVAINQTDRAQRFTIGTMAHSKGFEPLIVFDDLKPSDAITFKLPSLLRAFASFNFNCEVGQVIPHTGVRLLKSVPIADLGQEQNTCWHLYTGQQGLVLERTVRTMESPPLGEPPTFDALQDDNEYVSSPLSTPPLLFRELPFESQVPGSEEGNSPLYGSPLFTPPSTPDPGLSEPPSILGSPHFFPLDDLPSGSPRVPGDLELPGAWVQ